MKLKDFKVYVKGRGLNKGPYMVKAPDHDEAKLQLQKVMRKRFGKELYRDFIITKAVLVRRGTK
jgi:hypothetical protein